MQLLAKAPEAATAPTDEAVVRQHLLATWRYLRMHGASPQQADDLAQEAFVIALQKQAAHLDPAATATFLRRTARFLLLRRHRGSAAVELADAVDLLWTRDCEADGGDGLLLALRACVGGLSQRARAAIELSYGLGGDDARGRASVASELGMTENGVKTLLQRARQALRECLRRRQP